MFCSKCGKEIEKGTKFCPSCGSKAEEAKKETVKEPVKVENKPQTESNGLGIAGMVIGIISIILSFFLSIFVILIPIVGLILSCCAKGKKGFKITGIITNAVAIVLGIVVFIFSMALLGSAIGGFFEENDPQDVINEIKKEADNKVNEMRSQNAKGTWLCVDYYDSNINEYLDDVTKAPMDKKTYLILKDDGTFTYGPYVDSSINYYKGTYTATAETSKNEQYKSNNVTFFDVTGNITDAMIDGTKVYDKTSMHLEMELLGQYNYDSALILFYSSYNTYYCQR